MNCLKRLTVKFFSKTIFIHQYSVLRLCHGITNEAVTAHERIYMRKVLKSTAGCILCDPDKGLQHHSNKQIAIGSDINSFISLISIVQTQNRTYSFAQSHHVKKTLDSLNLIHLEQYKKWSIEKQLYALDLWHFTRPCQKYKIFHELMESVLKKFDAHENGAALQIMYYTAYTTRLFTPLQQQNVVRRLERSADDLTLDELSIYCLALTKNNTKLSSANVIDAFYKCLLQTDFRHFEDIAIVGVIKAVRRYSTADHIPRIVALQTKLVEFAKKSSFLALTHTAHFGLKQNVYNRELIDVIVRRLIGNLKLLRMKDIERICLVLATFQFKTSDQIEERFCDEVQSFLLQSMHTRHPESMVRCISYLAMRGGVDPKLIAWVLDPITLLNTFGNLIEYSDSHILIIDSYAKINLADSYKGHRLSDSVCNQLIQRFYRDTLDGVNTLILNDLKKIFNMNNINYVLWRAIPHFAIPDIIFVYDKKFRKSVELPKLMDGQIRHASELTKCDKGLIPVAVVVCSRAQTLFNSERYTGFFQLKLNQLKMLGYRVIVIDNKYLKLYASKEARKRYLMQEFERKSIFLFNKVSSKIGSKRRK